MQIPQNAGFAYAFLTARINRMVSTAAPPGSQQGQKKNVGNKVNAPKTTLAGKAPAPAVLPLTSA